MGKAQSKRSVDITTETKKGAEDEITEKMEKIEDLDKKETLNGDATLQEKQDLEKKDNEEVENDKDMTTEKNVDTQAAGDSTEAANSAETPKDESGPATAEEISPLADESVKKSKKEKVKKKWSFRSISFGKKDKQKPTKSEEAVEDDPTATNGPENDEKSPKDTEDSQKEKSANEIKGNSTESHENGDATQQELNGTEHNEQKPSEEKSNDLTANLTNNTTTEKSGPVQSETIVESSDISAKTEVTSVTTTINIESNISENNSTVGVSKNDNGESEVSNVTVQQDSQKVDVANAFNETSTAKTSTLTDATNELSAPTNGEVLEKIHQNGDNIDQEIVEQSKAQIEVNFNTDNKVSAATLDSFPSTSINPSNAHNHNKDLNATTKNADENLKTNNEEESFLSKSTDAEEGDALALPSVIKNVNTVDDINLNKQSEQNTLVPTEIIETENSATFENTIDEPSPPPLPISPPPSQVSVFAFTHSEEESVKDSIPTNISETVCPLIEENKEILPLNIEVLPDSANNINDIPENNEKSTEEEATNNDIESNENVHNNGLEEQTSCICKEELQENTSYTNSVLDSFEKKEEFSFAAEVIDEITEKAVEIVSLQLETNKNVHENNSVEKTELEKSNKDIINDKTVLKVENNVNHKELSEGNDASECKKDELTKYLLESTVASHQTNDTITESSLIYSESDAIQQTQSEMLCLSVEEHLNPTKEFGNAKDLKENAAAAEITQDLSVTCE